MRNRREIISQRPIKPAIYYRELVPSNSRNRGGYESRQRDSHRNKVVLVKMIDLRDKEDYQEEDEGYFFKRNRRWRDSEGSPVGKLELRRKSDEKSYDSFNMDEERKRGSSSLKNDVPGQQEYDQMLDLSKSQLLDKYTIPELRQFTTKIGGPINLAHHFDLKPTEIDQIFPPEIKSKNEKKSVLAKDPEIKNKPVSLVHSPSPNKELYTVGKKMNFKEKKMQKMIFTPLPYEIEARRSTSAKKRTLNKRASRSHIPVRTTKTQKMNNLRSQMDNMMRDSKGSTRVSQRLGRVKEIDREELMKERMERMKSRERKRSRVRGQRDVMRYLTKDDNENY